MIADKFMHKQSTKYSCVVMVHIMRCRFSTFKVCFFVVEGFFGGLMGSDPGSIQQRVET